MKHLILPYIFILAASAMVQSCDKNKAPGKESWNPAPVPAREIIVSANGSTMEKYEFVYDASGRPDSLRRYDIAGKKTLLDIRYSYGDGSDALISGVFSPDGKKQSILVNSSKDGLVYSNSAWNAWEYTLSLSGHLPVSIRAKTHFDANSGFVSSDCIYQESYTSRDGDIVEATAGTTMRGDTGTATKTFSENTITWQYTYISNEDKQNFNAFLMECVFPVWFAKGLPGCRHLISDIITLGGNVDYQSKQHIDYRFDENGNILSATRTWSSAGKQYLTLEYTFSY